MPHPAIIASLISGGASIFGDLFGGGEQHEAERIADPFTDPTRALLAGWLNNRVGTQRPPYPGQVAAGYNPALLAALTGLTGQGAQYGGAISGLMNRFLNPAGSMGWNPTAGPPNINPGFSVPGIGGGVNAAELLMQLLNTPGGNVPRVPRVPGMARYPRHQRNRERSQDKPEGKENSND